MPLKGYTSLCNENAAEIVSKDKNSFPVHKALNNNKNRVFHYHIDGDVIKTTEETKCDFLLLNDDKMDAYFIELKGSDIGHAIEQLNATYNHNKLQEIKDAYTCCFRVVLRRSNTHKINSSKVNAFRKRYNFKSATRRLEETI